MTTPEVISHLKNQRKNCRYCNGKDCDNCLNIAIVIAIGAILDRDALEEAVMRLEEEKHGKD